jgi:hypothetical protein
VLGRRELRRGAVALDTLSLFALYWCLDRNAWRASERLIAG